MNLKFISLFLFFTLGALSGADEIGTELPTVKVLSLNDQEELFVKAYEEVGPEKIHPTQTHIPGLKPMIEMHYSFVRGLVQDSPAHLELLKGFWQKTAKILETDQLTIGRMKSIALQLAFLLTDIQKGDKAASGVPEAEWGKVFYVKDLYETGQWKNIDRYENENLLYLYRRSAVVPEWVTGFECEAILCSKSGAFSYERFVKNYLARDFVLHLAAFPLLPEGQGPHAGTVYTSSEFLNHDFGHKEQFISNYYRAHGYGKDPAEGLSQLGGRQYWPTLKSLLKKIYDRPENAHANHMGIFWLLHEDVPYFSNSLEFPCLGEEAPLPFSERYMFLSLIHGLAQYKETATSSLSYMLYLHLPNPGCCWVENYKEKGDILEIELSFQEHQGGVLKKNLARFSVDLSFEPGKEEGTAKRKFSNVSQLIWNPESDFMDEAMKEEKAQEVTKWFASKDNGSETASLEKFYGIDFQDYEYGLKSLYGHDVVQEGGSVVQRLEVLCKGMHRFWTDFYHNNKDLFSTEPL